MSGQGYGIENAGVDKGEAMRVRQLMELLGHFDPEAEVRLCISLPNRVLEMHQRLWVGDYGGGPLISAAVDFRGFQVFVGCGLEQLVAPTPETLFEPAPQEKPLLDLGEYDSEEIARKVRDFYIVHRGLKEPLAYPEFDYAGWIPPRTRQGKYNEHIARILEEKLLQD